MISIQLNGAATDLKPNTSISVLLQQLGMADKRLAVEINLDIVPRSAYDSILINDGDKVEIVQAIGGG